MRLACGETTLVVNPQYLPDVDCLGAAADPIRCVETLELRAYRALRDSKRERDLLVRITGRDQAHDLGLARAETRLPLAAVCRADVLHRLCPSDAFGLGYSSAGLTLVVLLVWAAALLLVAVTLFTRRSETS